MRGTAANALLKAFLCHLMDSLMAEKMSRLAGPDSLTRAFKRRQSRGFPELIITSVMEELDGVGGLTTSRFNLVLAPRDLM